MKKGNSESVLYNLTKSIGVKVNRRSVEKCLQDHPEYPSLMSVSGCLNEWGVENYGHRVDTSEANLDEIPTPFIAHSMGKFILIEEIRNGIVTYSDEILKKSKYPIPQLLKRWKGISLHSTVLESSGEMNYWKNRIKFFLQDLKLPLAGVLLTIILYVSFFSIPFNWISLLLLTLKMAGIAVTVLLLMHSINANNEFINNLCKLGANNGCNEILKSNASKITPWLNWSEVGFFYFAGSLLALLLIPTSLSILRWINLLAIPYTIYSISYQYKTKNWCVLCCSVQVLLVLEALTFFLGRTPFSMDFKLQNISMLFFCFLLPILVWSYLKPLCKADAELPHIKKQLKKYKCNSALFDQALKNQPRYAVNETIDPIILGNPEAVNVVTLVSNPFCGPCSEAHKLVEDWLKNDDTIQLKIIFAVKNKEGDRPTRAAKHLSAINDLGDRNLLEKAVNEWYNMETNDYENWAKKFPIELTTQADTSIQRQADWCEMAEITFTPTVLVNGYKLPNPYQLEDIKYFLS
ncbi:thioredoxin domain-containing protein [Pedobacter sp. Du54]|uniref:thioredoxin domain-containing protein n=1 Tax=Pedobacter anseongensis TaxID=3133439 RepID=UPI0030A89078